MRTENDASHSLPVIDYDAATGKFAYAIADIRQSLRSPKLIMTLVLQDFASRYNGTTLGGFWITLTTLASVTGLALLYSQIFDVSLKLYFPYVAVGIIIWGVISGLISDSVSTFINGASVFNQMPLAKSLFVFQTLGRSLVVVFFKSIILVGVLIFTGVNPGLTGYLLSAAGFALIMWVGFWITLTLGTLGARYRDVGQLCNVGLTFAFFVTPVFWRTERLGDYQFIIDYNPFYHFLNIVRAPLVGLEGVGSSFVWAGVIAAITTITGAVSFGLYARRISYWC